MKFEMSIRRTIFPTPPFKLNVSVLLFGEVVGSQSDKFSVELAETFAINYRWSCDRIATVHQRETGVNYNRNNNCGERASVQMQKRPSVACRHVCQFSYIRVFHVC